MINFKKKSSTKLSEHFNSNELDCKCNNDDCINQFISKELIDKLELVRAELNESITITSGFRCAKKQQEIRGKVKVAAKGISTHEEGIAVDVTINNHTEERLKHLLDILAKHFMSIGLAKTFYHVDLRTDKPNRRWNY